MEHQFKNRGIMFNGEGQTLRTIGSEFNCDWQTQNNDWSDNQRRFIPNVMHFNQYKIKLKILCVLSLIQGSTGQ